MNLIMNKIIRSFIFIFIFIFIYFLKKKNPSIPKQVPDISNLESRTAIPPARPPLDISTLWEAFAHKELTNKQKNKTNKNKINKKHRATAAQEKDHILYIRTLIYIV